MQVVRRKTPAIILQFHRCWSVGMAMRVHSGLIRHFPAFFQVTRRTGSCDVLPSRLPAAGAGNQMVKCQIIMATAVLTGEFITQEEIKPGKSRIDRLLKICLESNHGWQLHLERRAADGPVILVYNLDPVEENSFYSTLPRPERQRIIAERPEIGVQHQGRAGIRR